MIRSTALVVAPLLLLIDLILLVFLYRLLYKSGSVIKRRGFIKVCYMLTVVILAALTLGTYGEYSNEATFHRIYPQFEEPFYNQVAVDYPQIGQIMRIHYLYFMNSKLSTGSNGQRTNYSFDCSLLLDGADNSVTARYAINNTNGSWNVEAQK